jgi:hypothetical protein
MPSEFDGDVSPGDFYEDCSYHPCLCIRVHDDEISGVSLVDGSYPRSCDIHHCGIRKLTLDEAMWWKFYGPKDIELPQELQWWQPLAGTAWMYWPPPAGEV